MKKLLIYLVGALMLGAAWPALAGPDFQVIEKARMTKQTALMSQETLRSGDSTATKCPPQPLVLPLDDGPRAQTTPGENRLRKARYEAEVKACASAVK